MYLRKPGETGEAQSRSVGKGVKQLLEDMPGLAEYLMRDSYDDGSDRQTSTMIVFIEDGWWKVCLSDRDEGTTLWATGETLDDCLIGLDAAIVGGTAEWRRSSQRPRGKRGK